MLKNFGHLKISEKSLSEILIVRNFSFVSLVNSKDQPKNILLPAAHVPAVLRWNPVLQAQLPLRQTLLASLVVQSDVWLQASVAE